MARHRTIKPEFWTDEKTGPLSDFAKCLFMGILNYCDDYGVIEWNMIKFASNIFPYRNFSIAEDDGSNLKTYLYVKNFSRHQKINRPSKPLLNGWKIGDTLESFMQRFGDYATLSSPLVDQENSENTTIQ